MRAEEYKALILDETRKQPNRPRTIDSWRVLRLVYRWRLAIEGSVLGLVVVAITLLALATLSSTHRTTAALAINVFALDGGLGFTVAPSIYALALAHALRIGILSEAEVVAARPDAESAGETELLVPHPKGAFRKEFNPKRVWVVEGRATVGSKVLTLVHPSKQRVLVEIGPAPASEHAGLARELSRAEITDPR
jgi:hypothetical protein